MYKLGFATGTATVLVVVSVAAASARERIDKPLLQRHPQQASCVTASGKEFRDFNHCMQVPAQRGNRAMYCVAYAKDLTAGRLPPELLANQQASAT